MKGNSLSSFLIQGNLTLKSAPGSSMGHLGASSRCAPTPVSPAWDSLLPLPLNPYGWSFGLHPYSFLSNHHQNEADLTTGAAAVKHDRRPRTVMLFPTTTNLHFGILLPVGPHVHFLPMRCSKSEVESLSSPVCQHISSHSVNLITFMAQLGNFTVCACRRVVCILHFLLPTLPTEEDSIHTPNHTGHNHTQTAHTLHQCRHAALLLWSGSTS